MGVDCSGCYELGLSRNNCEVAVAGYCCLGVLGVVFVFPSDFYGVVSYGVEVGVDF